MKYGLAIRQGRSENVDRRVVKESRTGIFPCSIPHHKIVKIPKVMVKKDQMMNHIFLPQNG
jgi:hypothetical protein